MRTQLKDVIKLAQLSKSFGRKKPLIPFGGIVIYKSGIC